METLNLDPLVSSQSRIENLMHMVTFDPVRMSGKIITNTSMVDSKYLDMTLQIFRKTMESGLTVSPFIKIEDDGRRAKIHTTCSITIDGVLLKRGIPMRPKGGGVIEVVNLEPIRFTEMLMYWATTIDPIDVLICQELTSVTRMTQTGNGRILGNLQEAHMLARDRIEEMLEILAEAEFAGVLELGEPNVSVLGVPVERDHLGVALVGGTNILAAAVEQGLDIGTESISGLVDVSEMSHIEDLV